MQPFTEKKKGGRDVNGKKKSILQVGERPGKRGKR